MYCSLSKEVVFVGLQVLSGELGRDNCIEIANKAFILRCWEYKGVPCVILFVYLLKSFATGLLVVQLVYVWRCRGYK